ncbi:hypothetical protein AB0M28_23500 [Streptomyces sp. NPDC051940]|uniref:hypothetical protein n=1 Tax=Streptomyces sp. NPDC051940 TaxID=3155675 RepID=UPI0034401F4F
MTDEFRDDDVLQPPVLDASSLSNLDVDIRLAVIEYADVAASYAAVATACGVPPTVLRDYEIVVDVLALARRLPADEVPAVLVIGTRALKRVHRSLMPGTGGSAAA